MRAQDNGAKRENKNRIYILIMWPDHREKDHWAIGAPAADGGPGGEEATAEGGKVPPPRSFGPRAAGLLPGASPPLAGPGAEASTAPGAGAGDAPERCPAELDNVPVPGGTPPMGIGRRTTRVDLREGAGRSGRAGLASASGGPATGGTPLPGAEGSVPLPAGCACGTCADGLPRGRLATRPAVVPAGGRLAGALGPPTSAGFRCRKGGLVFRDRACSSTTTSWATVATGVMAALGEEANRALPCPPPSSLLDSTSSGDSSGSKELRGPGVGVIGATGDGAAGTEPEEGALRRIPGSSPRAVQSANRDFILSTSTRTESEMQEHDRADAPASSHPGRAKFTASAQFRPWLNPAWYAPGKVIMNSPWNTV